MCGITGLIDSRGPSRDLLEKMTGSLRHRGPDAEGFWLEGPLALGHRRLSILDLTPSGTQPMVSASGDWVIVLNGEIYNFQELRRSLPDVRFRGNSDTEVLLELMDRRGFEAALREAAGMFALAAWNRKEQTLWLARDRLGEKPLYWAETPHGLCFGSEPKAIRPALSLTPRLEALRTYLDIGYVPHPFTAWNEIQQLPPGHLLYWRNGKASAPAPYWRLPAPGGVPSSTEEVEAVLSKVVRQQMISDVPLGVFLSGGIDSSLVTALMREAAPVRSFSIAFEESGYNEAPMAREVAKALGTNHTELTVTARDALGFVTKIADIWDEPFADSSQIPTALLAQLTRQHVTVALSGDGGDEVFAGYNRHILAPKLWNRVSAVPLALRTGAATLSRVLPEAFLREALLLLRPGTPQPAEKFQKLTRSLSASSLEDLYRSLTLVGTEGTRLMPSVLPLPRYHCAGHSTDLLQRLDLGEYLPGDILVKVDRAAMASSLETRAPFLDHRVVETALRLPSDLRVKAGRGKIALRDLLLKRLPVELIDRPKTGFAVPLAQWLRGPLRDWAGDAIEQSRKVPWLDEKASHSMWKDFQAGDSSHAHQLWALINLLEWTRRN